MVENGDDEPTIKLAPGSSQALRHQFASMPATDRPLAVDEEPTVQLPSRPALPAIHEQSTAPMSTVSDRPPVSPLVGGSVPIDELPTTPRPVAPITPIPAAPPAVPP